LPVAQTRTIASDVARQRDCGDGERPYAAAMSTGDALAELRRCSGSQFDPHVVDTFHTVMARRSQAPNAAGSAPALAQMQR
jgi:HD-GYP domain-containing protein (c-di-GMP phosphodiesterase class II)